MTPMMTGCVDAHDRGAGSNALHSYFLDHKTATLSLASKVSVAAGTNPM
jgi:hypothetical protein